MALDELSIIRQFFQPIAGKRADVVLGSGDDCALVRIPADHECAISVDTLVAGIHFHENATAGDIAYKAMAVNLSDLAAMGAQPCWITIALTLPQNDEKWLRDFSLTLSEIIKKYNLQLIGGDLTHGPLSITIQAHGLIPKGKAILRSHAKVGDDIYVTGPVGLAALAVDALHHKVKLSENDFKIALRALEHPIPRIQEGIMLRELAHAAIDISDGLAADLAHILEASHVGATIDLTKIPMSPLLKKYCSEKKAYNYALAGGDDYELCFTAPKSNANALKNFTRIGEITKNTEMKILDASGSPFLLKSLGYQHFT